MGQSDRKLVYSTDDPADEDSPFAFLRGQMNDDDRPDMPAGEEPAPPSSSKTQSTGVGAQVRVQRERKGRRGKTVSVITGVPGPESRRQDLLKQLKQKLGTGGSLEGDNIVIQGDHRDRAVDLLNQMGFKAKAAGG
ncbi:MAG: translation initiation factor [Caldilineales bacterium]